MNYQILRGFCLGGGIDTTPGETRTDIPDFMAPRLVQMGKIKALSADNPLIEAIAAAPDLDTLETLLSEDPAIVTAYETRVEQLSAKPARGRK